MPKSETPYVKVPNAFIQCKISNNVTWDNFSIRLFLFVYIVSSVGLFGQCSFSTEQLLRMIGIKTRSKSLINLKIYSTLIETIQWFVDNGYISQPNVDLQKINPTAMITVNILCEDTGSEGFLSGSKFNVKDKFTQITKWEFETLIKITEKKKPLTHLFVYCYIKSRIINKNPECCIASCEEIQNACGLSKATIQSVLNNLRNLGLLEFKRPNNIRKYKLNETKKYGIATGKFSNLKTVFVINKPGYEKELADGIKQYTEENEKKYKYL